MNDSSLQNQFVSDGAFIAELSLLLKARAAHARLRDNLFASRTFGFRPVTDGRSVASIVNKWPDRDFRAQVLSWVTRDGPFFEDDRLPEGEDYFECLEVDVTDAGLGEAARRQKANQAVGAFSFVGGASNFGQSPLAVNHGLLEETLGVYEVANHWQPMELQADLRNSEPTVTSWQTMVEVARERYSRILVPNTVYSNPFLVAEPFEVAIADRALRLLGYLDEYMASRNADGSASDRTNEIIRTLFSNAEGARPLFTGESATNQRIYKSDLTFADPEEPTRAIFAHWHGKISHRFFRLHFEWPVPTAAKQLKVLYLGPKLTKD